MTDCKDGAGDHMRAAVLDVTPDEGARGHPPAPDSTD